MRQKWRAFSAVGRVVLLELAGGFMVTNARIGLLLLHLAAMAQTAITVCVLCAAQQA